jgi:hypothetical protein
VSLVRDLGTRILNPGPACFAELVNDDFIRGWRHDQRTTETHDKPSSKSGNGHETTNARKMYGAARFVFSWQITLD